MPSTTETLYEYEFQVRIPEMTATTAAADAFSSALRLTVKAPDRETAERYARHIFEGERPRTAKIEIEPCPWTREE